MLDTRELRTTNSKMKLASHLVGLLIMGLLVPLATADISLKLKNQQYQDSQISGNQQKFEESKYGNAKYHQFEVHNQLGSDNGRALPRNPSGNSNNSNKNNHNSALSTEEIRIEHINAPPGFPLDNPDLDASLLNVASEGGHSQIILKHENVPTSSLANINIPVPFPSNYQHDFPEKSTENFVDYEVRQEDLTTTGPKQNSAPNQGDSDSFQGSKYLPPLNNQQVENQQYSQQAIGNPFKESDFLPPPPPPPPSQSYNNDLTQYKGPDYLPPHSISDSKAVPFRASQYLPPDDDNNPFKGPGYLPPQQSSAGQQQQDGVNSNNLFKPSDYLPSSESGFNQETLQRSKPFKGADYLPPPNSNAVGQQGYFQPNQPFSGPDYLPPRRQQQQQGQSQHQQPINDAGFKASSYLPPGYDFQRPSNAEDAIAELHTLPERTNNNQNQHQFPQTQVTVQSHIQVAGTQAPSDIVYGTHKQGNDPQASGPSSQQAGAYLPPENSENSGHQVPSTSSHNNLHSPTQSGRESGRYSAPGYLPPGYDFQKPVETEQVQGPNYQESGGQQQQSFPQSQTSTGQTQNYHNQPQNFGKKNVQPAYKGPGYLPPLNSPQPAFKGPGYLPPTSKTPYHNAQQPTQVYNGPNFLSPTTFAPQSSAQQSGQVFKAPEYLPPNMMSHIGTMQTFQGPGYLPPTNSAHIFSNLAFKASGYLPPFTSSRQPNYQPSIVKAPDYLPPKVKAKQAQPAPHSSYMHPLSSYMTNVQPFERYGSTRKPFADYGPPQNQFAPILPISEVAPMYKEAASRPQYYAPAMSYATNAISSQVYNSQDEPHVTQSTPLSQQAREALQTFMPQDIREGSTTFQAENNHVSSISSTATPKMTTSTPVSAKIRTVQIVNTSAVKTLKVLESLDHTGVKTIKILGLSNETPMGEHRVVKVVSGREQTVQTVKIYNDQQDYTPSAAIELDTAPAQSPSNSDYLPSRHKRNPKKLSVKGRQRITGN